jgi:hypothetical protein
MQWTPVRHGKAIVALQSGDYVIAKEQLFDDFHYFAMHSGQLISVTCDADRAKQVCDEHAAGVVHFHENGDGV